MKFEIERAAAVDTEYDVRIFRPRILPARTPGYSEFDFPIFHENETDGFSCVGRILPADTKVPYETWLLEIDAALQVSALLRMKKDFGADESDFPFLCGFAAGMASVYGDGYRLNMTTRFVVTINESLLRDRNINVVPEHPRWQESKVILADRLVQVKEVATGGP